MWDSKLELVLQKFGCHAYIIYKKDILTIQKYSKKVKLAQ